MFFILIIFVIAFAGAAALAFAVYRQGRSLPGRETGSELPRQPVLLFADESNESDSSAQPPAPDASLIERARQGDLNTLREARHEAQLYQDVLNTLIDWCERQEGIATLVRHLARSDDLRANVRLAEQVIRAWQAAPDRRSTVDMLHIAGLADDARTYRRAVNLAIEAFQNGRLAGFSADELLALLESQFWLLNTEAQRGGDGFTLKQRLAEARRELAAAASAK